MSSGFSISAQVRLLAPTNLNQISTLIRSKLENIDVKITSALDKNLARDINNVTKSLAVSKGAIDDASDSMRDFGRQTALTIKRFGAYTVVTAGFFRFIGSVNKGIKEAIDFQDQLIKIRQVTGESLLSLRSLTGEIDRLATGFGVSSKELLSASQVLAQAGLTAKEVRVSLQALAKSDLAPTFDNINKTAEASIAILRQFGLNASDLESKLSSINSVSAKFAVESGDITSAIQRTGGAFAAAGGSLEELVSLFTSVRATTRESADSIATGFRTIFTRIQRTRTQNFLSDLGVDLKEFGDDARALGKEGLFVGPFESIKRLSLALKDLNSADPRFAQIVEELGGFRQISKVIPLIQQFSVSENALGVALRGTNSLTEDAEKRQESLAIQIKKVREEFQVLLRQFGNSESFQIITKTALEFTSALIKISSALEPIIQTLPLLFFPALSKSASSFVSGFSKKSSIRAMKEGGKISGVGNKDSELIAAMPGEFVLRKSAVEKYGPDFLERLNEGKIGKFAKGGIVGKTVAGAGAALGTGLLIQNIMGKELGPFSKIIGVVATQFFVMSKVLSLSSSNIDEFNQKIANIGGENTNIQSGIDDLSKERKSILQQRRVATQELADAVEREKIAKTILKKDQERVKAEIERAKAFDASIRASVPPGSSLSNTRGVEDLARQRTGVESKRIRNLIGPSILAQRDIKNDASSNIDKQNQELKILDDKIAAERELLKTNKDLQNSNAALARNARLLNNSVAIAASVLTGFSLYLDEISNKELDKLRRTGSFDEGTARRSFVGGQAAVGGAVGGAAGLGIASTLGLSTGPGALVVAATAIGLSLYNANKALKEFESQLKIINNERVSNDLSTALAAVANGGTPRDLAFGVNKSVRTLSSGLALETDKNARDSITAAIDASTSSLIDFVRKASLTASSLQDLDRVVSLTTQQLVADKTNTSLANFRIELEKTIKAQRESVIATERAISLNRQFEIGVLSQRALDAAAQNAADSLTLLSSGASQVFTGEGLGFGKSISSVFTSASTGVADNKDLSSLAGFAANFGKASSLLAQNSIDAANAIKILPNVLLEIRSSDPLGQTGNFTTRLDQLLEKAKVGDGVRDAILNNIRDLIGPEGQDANVIQKINENFLGVLDEIAGNLTNRNKGIFDNLETSSVSALKSFNDGLISASKSLDEIAESRARVFDNDQAFLSILSSVSGKDNFNAERNLENQRRNSITGGFSPEQLLNRLATGKQNEGQLREDLTQTQDLEKRKQIIIAINNEQRAINSVTKALNELSNFSRMAAISQRELAEETRGRLGRRDLAIKAFVANPEERRQEKFITNLTRVAIGQAAKGVDVRQNFQPEQLKEIVSFLQSIGDIKIGALGGLTGKEGIDVLLNAGLAREGLGRGGITEPGAAENKLIQEINAARERANKIEIELANQRFIQEQTFVNNLNTGFTDFITNLKTQIDRIFQNEKDTRSQSIIGDLERKQAQLNIGSGIKNLTGNDPQTVLSSFSSILKLVESENKNKTLKAQSGNTFTNLDLSNIAKSQFNKGGNVGGNFVSGVIGLARQRSPELASELENTLRSGGFSDIIKNVNDQAELAKRTISTSSDPETKRRNTIAAEGRLGNKASEEIFQILRNVGANVDNNLLQLGVERQGLSTSVGGDASLNKIISNLGNLEPVIKNLPQDINFNNLTSEISNLRIQLQRINGPQPNLPPKRFNLGGFVPGVGNSDIVNAKLTPGEFVVNAPTVEKYGVDFFQALNTQKLNTGGQVQSGMNMDFMNNFNSSISRLSAISDKLSQSFASIPSEITLRATHRVEVIHTGAQVFAQLEPTLVNLIERQTNKAINNMIMQKFPEVGEVL